MSEVFRDTRDTWKRFSRTQKLAFCVVNGLTILRPILAEVVSRRGRDPKHKWTKSDSAITGITFLTDLEGKLAEATGVQTKLGGILDPISDKVATNRIERTLVNRGEESSVRANVRLARDIGVSAVRKYALMKTNGEASVSAGLSGKVNSAFRQSTDVFATSPLGEKYPRTRSALQSISTVGTVASGAHTIMNLLKQTKESDS